MQRWYLLILAFSAAATHSALSGVQRLEISIDFSIACTNWRFFA
jgi:hypothetical protein